MSTSVRVRHRIIRAGSLVTIGWEPLHVKFHTPPPGHVFLVTHLSCLGFFAVNTLGNPQGPGAGWYLIGDSLTHETLSDAQAGMNLQARGMPIEMQCNSSPLAVGFAFNCLAVLRQPLPINPGETVRFMASCNPGTIQPGPGVGSYCSATMVVVEEVFA